jgi:hypothetical protein
MKTMTARYPGRCARTGAPIRPGDTIVYVGKGRAYLSDLLPAVDPDLFLARSIDPDLADSDPDAAAHAGRYIEHLEAALRWALEQVEDDLCPDHQAALADAWSLLEDE